MRAYHIPYEAVLVSNSQEVRAIKRHIGRKAYGFKSFFVIARDGDYEAVWGMRNSIPYLDDEVIQII